MYGFPDDFGIDTKIFVRQQVAHVSHFFPGNTRIFLDDIIRYVPRCFADYFEIANNRIYRFGISFKIPVSIIRCIFVNFFDGGKNITNPDIPVSRRPE